MQVVRTNWIRAVLTLVVVLLAGGSVWAQSTSSLRSEADVSRLEEIFLDRFMSGEFAEAFGLFRSSASALSAAELDGLLESTARQLSSLANSYGLPIDAVMAGREMVGGALLRRTYLLRYQALPLRAQFIYYWNDSVWRLTYFSWDDQYTELFGE